jgi:hypothetical protein
MKSSTELLSFIQRTIKLIINREKELKEILKNQLTKIMIEITTKIQETGTKNLILNLMVL